MQEIDSCLSGISIVKEVMMQNKRLAKLKKMATKLFPDIPEHAYEFIRIKENTLVVKMKKKAYTQQVRYMFHSHLIKEFMGVTRLSLL